MHPSEAALGSPWVAARQSIQQEAAQAAGARLVLPEWRCGAALTQPSLRVSRGSRRQTAVTFREVTR